MLPARPDICSIEVPPLLDGKCAEALTDALTRAEADPTIRLVVFSGRDPGVFSRGFDLEGVIAGKVPATTDLMAVAGCLKTLYRFPKPKLAIVGGAAIAGGLGLAAACDWILASETATFALPELLWGFVPAAIWPLLIRRVGPVRAQAWALTAVARSAREALSIGLIDEVVADDQLGAAARRVVKLLLRPDPEAVRLLRSWSAEAETLPVVEAIDRGAAITAEWLGRREVQTKLAGFFTQSGDVPWRSDQT